MLPTIVANLRGKTVAYLAQTALASPDDSDKKRSHGTNMARCCTAALQRPGQSLDLGGVLLGAAYIAEAQGRHLPSVAALILLSEVHP